MKIRNFIILGTVLASSSLGACKKNDNSSQSPAPGQAKVSFTINGDGYSSRTITIIGTTEESEGVYFSKYGFTMCNIGDKPNIESNDINSFAAYFNGNTTGSQNIGTEFSNKLGPQEVVNITFDLTRDGTSSTYGINESNYSRTPGMINVTKYEQVKGTIEAYFSGTLINADTGDSVKITQGHFVVPRNEDLIFNK